MPHPLAAPTSPLAHVLARYDEADPRDGAALARAEAAARGRGVKELRFEPGAVPHSGAHALFAAWLATKVGGRCSRGGTASSALGCTTGNRAWLRGH